MVHSPFLANRQRKLASVAAAKSAPAVLAEPRADTDAGQEYATLRAVLHDHLRKLQDVASHEARIPMKAQFMEDFRPWIEGVLEADEPVQDEILLTCMVWCVDIGEFAAALELGGFAIKHGLAMPERYNRNVACFLREEIAVLAINQKNKFNHQTLVELDRLTHEADMPDPAKAKLNKALGRSWFAKAEAFDPEDDTGAAGAGKAFAQEAVTNFERALHLDREVGVKKDLERAKRLLNKLTTDDEE